MTYQKSHKRSVFEPILVFTIPVLVILGVIYALFEFVNEKSFSKTNQYVSSSQMSQINADELLKLTNGERQKKNLKPLSRSTKLDQAAELKLNDMVGKNYWDHVSPSGKSPWNFFSLVGYSYIYAGENLARDFYDVESLVNAWMNSKEHKENILSPNFTEVGFAVKKADFQGIKNTTLVVQELGTPVYLGSGQQPVRQEINITQVKDHLAMILKVKDSWSKNNDRYSREDINRLLDNFNRQIDFCNTLINNLENKKGSYQDNINLWNTTINLSNESAALANKLLGK